MTATSFRAEGRRAAITWAAIAVVIMVAVVALRLALPEQNDTPYHPASTGRRGTKALAQTLTELGATVTVTAVAPRPGQYSTVLVDGGSRWTATRLRPYIEAGGTVLVATSTSVGPRPSLPVGGARSEACPVPALAEVRRLAGTTQYGFDSSRPGSVHCLVDSDGASLIAVTPMGRGWVVSVAVADAFTNLHLGSDDNAVLATAVLIPRPGATVAILNADAGDAPVPPGAEDGPRFDADSAVHPGVWLAILQGGLVFVTAAFWRGRRLGRPVLEDPAVSLPGSELVAAVGRLWHRGRRVEDAGRVASADARRRASVLLGVPREAPMEAFVAAASRHGVAPEITTRAFDPAPVDTEADLLDRMAAIDDVLAGLAHPPRTGSGTTGPGTNSLDLTKEPIRD